MAMRTLVISIWLIACGSDPDPHTLGECVGWTNNDGSPFTGECEAACKMKPTSTGTTCNTIPELNCAAFKFSGVQGCCVFQGQSGQMTIIFAECNPHL